jgi:hypothetical protein
MKTKVLNIIEPISITLNNSYRLDVWEREVIGRCMRDNPSSSMIEWAKLLGVSERVLYRLLEKYKDVKSIRTQIRESRRVDLKQKTK